MKTEIPTSPWVDISLDNLVHNLHQIKQHVPQHAGIMAVVKDNAYGCGSIPVAQVLEKNGVRFFAVACMHEAMALRFHSIKSPILVLGESSPGEIEYARMTDIRITLNDIQTLKIWHKLRSPVLFHCKIDTGMGRMGIHPDELPTLIAFVKRHPLMHMEGLFTHFACADEPGSKTVGDQLALFQQSRTILADHGIKPLHVHCANSAAVLQCKLPDCTLIRPGISLYGCTPDPARKFPANLKPVLSLTGRVVKIKTVSKNTPISYGGHYVTKKKTCIATIHTGYAHGLSRTLSNKGHVLLRGKQYTISGNVTMDYCMVDVGPASNIRVGDEAVFIGTQGPKNISPDAVALQCNTIAYEVLCRINPCLERRYWYKSSLYHKQSPAPF